MILIDFTYINSHGGLNIAQYVLEYISQKKSFDNYLILFDKRNFLKLKTYDLKHIVINNNEISRYIFYLKNNFSFNSIICFANVPPPIKQTKKVKVFFHNELLLNTKGTELPFLRKIIFYIKRTYIGRLNYGYNWHVQTSYLKKLLSETFNIKNEEIIISPIFKEIISNKKTKIPNSFLYPTSNYKHKNNRRLISAFIDASKRINHDITLKLTLEQPKFNKLKLPENLKVEYLGQLKNEELIKHYAVSKYLIFPSLKESFGLPLVEGFQSGCIILASDLRFVHEVLETKNTFNPYKIKDIAEKIILVLTRKTSNQVLKVNNLIHKIFEDEI